MTTGWLSLDAANNDANRFFGDVQEMVTTLGIDSTRPTVTTMPRARWKMRRAP
ncbi:MAG: hypothetical protein IPG43_04675, partial [Proteobacteria bacterium]|nr:hypothetical protein [Pseudomonadota bacterium]